MGQRQGIFAGKKASGGERSFSARKRIKMGEGKKREELKDSRKGKTRVLKRKKKSEPTPKFPLKRKNIERGKKRGESVFGAKFVLPGDKSTRSILSFEKRVQ